MTRRLPVPVGNFNEVYDLMFTYDEHSGAGNTGWPQLNSSEPLRQQNREYVEFTDTRRSARRMSCLQTGIGILADPSRFEERDLRHQTSTRIPLMIYNGLAWNRNDVVRLTPPSEGSEDHARFEILAGAIVPFDIDESGDAIFVARNVPSMGYVTYEVTTVAGKAAPTLRDVPSAATAENTRFSRSR